MLLCSHLFIRFYTLATGPIPFPHVFLEEQYIFSNSLKSICNYKVFRIISIKSIETDLFISILIYYICNLT